MLLYMKLDDHNYESGIRRGSPGSTIASRSNPVVTSDVAEIPSDVLDSLDFIKDHGFTQGGRKSVQHLLNDER
jgi:hypothetical protein